MIDAILWFVTQLGLAAWNIVYAITHPATWLDWSNGEALMRFVYYGASSELFFAVLLIFLVLTVVGMIHTQVLWAVVRGLEFFANGVGRIAAWAGLLMVLQQTVIVFLQRIFVKAEISFGFGNAMTFDVSWWAEELKLYNAIVVCLCCAYTFVQGGHVRVDLVYAPLSYGKRKIVDMAGALFLMAPMAILIWLYGWFFMWRHLINPPVSASDPLDRMLLKARAVRWSVETIGFSPNGFNAYFLFKVLMVIFAGMVFLQAIAFFYRSYLEWREGPDAEEKYLDKDVLADHDDVGVDASHHSVHEGM